MFKKVKNISKEELYNSHPERFCDLTMEQQDVLLAWLYYESAPNDDLTGTCYGLKQRFTREHFYINSGAMKGALLMAGFKPKDTEVLNWQFNICRAKLEDLGIFFNGDFYEVLPGYPDYEIEPSTEIEEKPLKKSNVVSFQHVDF